MISGDVSILNQYSLVGKRTEEYRNILGEIEILLCYGSILSFISGFYNGCKLIHQKKFDVITAQGPEHWFLAWILSYFYKIPWQMQIHTDIFSLYFGRESLKSKMRVIFAKFLIPRTSCIRVVSERIRKSILSRFNLDSVVLPIFVDVEKIKNAPVKIDLHQKYPDKFIILMASRLTKEKNIGLAIEALSSLIRTNGRIMLLIVGDGSEKENLWRIAYSLRLRDNIVFEHWTDDLISYYKTCDLFLLTSNYEGYGMTLVEAASAGTKIVSSDVGIAPEILEKENIFHVGDKDDLIQKLKLASEGKIKSVKPIVIQTKEEYLKFYKEGLEQCLKK